MSRTMHAPSRFGLAIPPAIRELLAAVDEALEIGRALDVPVEVSHLKAAGRRNQSGHTRPRKSLVYEPNSAARGRISAREKRRSLKAGETRAATFCLAPGAASPSFSAKVDFATGSSPRSGV